MEQLVMDEMEEQQHLSSGELLHIYRDGSEVLVDDAIVFKRVFFGKLADYWPTVLGLKGT